MKVLFIYFILLFVANKLQAKALDLDISGNYIFQAYSLPQDKTSSINLEQAFMIKPSWLIFDHWALHSRMDFLASQLSNQEIALRSGFKSGIKKLNKVFLSALYLKYDYKNHGGYAGLKPLSFGLGISHNDASIIDYSSMLSFNSQPALAYWFTLGPVKVETRHAYFKEELTTATPNKKSSYKSAYSFKVLYGGEDWTLNYLYHKDLKFSAHNIFASNKTINTDTALEFVLSSPLKGANYNKSAFLLSVDWAIPSMLVKVNNSFMYASGDDAATKDIDESYHFSNNKFMGHLFELQGSLTNTMASSIGFETILFKKFINYTYLLYAQTVQGADKHLGIELSTAIKYFFNKRLSWSNTLYVLSPGKALQKQLTKRSLGFYSLIAISF